jgi:hypothetical protein
MSMRLRYPRSVLLAAALGALTCFGALLPGAALASEPGRPAIKSLWERRSTPRV